MLFDPLKFMAGAEKAAVNAPHSKRAARSRRVQVVAKRLACGGFSTAFWPGNQSTNCETPCPA
jgi:hypothetical protein